MLHDIPTLARFTRLYWNMSADAKDIERAFRLMLEDARQFPDQGRDFYNQLSRELHLITGNKEYDDWLEFAFGDRRSVRESGGRFLMPKRAPQLLAILKEYRSGPEVRPRLR